jgi:phenylalanine-4-hydroxylase
LKESRTSDTDAIEDAQAEVEDLQNRFSQPSEMTHIKNLHWWTVEYGLIGDLQSPKIYGAGLLSSIGESKSCLKKEVRKLHYNISAAHQPFDITKAQPQLYVTPDFAHLSFVLEEYANTMSIRKGGLESIYKLIASEQIGTAQYNTGIQISGLFKEVIVDQYYQPIYIITHGPTALSYQQKELIGHSTNLHKDGLGAPVGKLKNINLPIESMSPYDLSAYKIKEGEYIVLSFEGGVTVEGEVITGKRNLQGVIIMISFKNCYVRYQDRVLHHPDMGIYHMPVGSKISSAFAGAADHDSFDLCDHTISPIEELLNKSKEQLNLESLYHEVNTIRLAGKIDFKRLEKIEEIISNDYPNDWLLKYEIQEIKASCLSTTN